MQDDKPLKVMCPRPNCNAIVAHIYGTKMVSVKRSKNMIQNLGNDYNMILTCSYKDCATRTSIICENGKIKLDNLKILEEKEEETLDIKEENHEEAETEADSETDTE